MDNGALDHSMEHGDGVNHGSVMALQRGTKIFLQPCASRESAPRRLMPKTKQKAAEPAAAPSAK